jgi:hypothetical protein
LISFYSFRVRYSNILFAGGSFQPAVACFECFGKMIREEIIIARECPHPNLLPQGEGKNGI